MKDSETFGSPLKILPPTPTTQNPVIFNHFFFFLEKEAFATIIYRKKYLLI